MLFYLFLTFQILYSVSSHISCYVCPSNMNEFNYLITVDRIPEQLNNCSLTQNFTACAVTLIWQKNPEQTQITTNGAEGRKSVLNQHMLDVTIGFENKLSTTKWEKIIIYECTTNECNHFNQIKRLLNSLTIIDELDQIKDIITPQEPFQGQWCEQGSNATFIECGTKIPDDKCKICSLGVERNQTGIEFCATCLTENDGDNFLSRSVMINMIDRTRTDVWQLQCRSNKCNSLSNGELIRQKAQIDFDFVKFFNNGHRLISFVSMNIMFLIYMVFMIEFHC
ncbi:hypothetical protein I4U23_020309 [Adineta vaga]|nr:hypothetical protein I4U23_020309 [Adineta vaga]